MRSAPPIARPLARSFNRETVDATQGGNPSFQSKVGKAPTIGGASGQASTGGALFSEVLYFVFLHLTQAQRASGNLNSANIRLQAIATAGGEGLAAVPVEIASATHSTARENLGIIIKGPAIPLGGLSVHLDMSVSMGGLVFPVSWGALAIADARTSMSTDYAVTGPGRGQDGRRVLQPSPS
jgi:hypothetical protein